MLVYRENFHLPPIGEHWSKPLQFTWCHWLNQETDANVQCYISYLYSFTVHVVTVHCLKTQLMHYTLKYTLKRSHSLKHQNVCVCCVTLHASVIHLTIFWVCTLHEATFRRVASSRCYLGMWPYVLSVLLSCVPLCCRSCCVPNKTDSREVYTTTTQIEDTATYPSNIVTKQQGGKQHRTRYIP